VPFLLQSKNMESKNLHQLTGEIVATYKSYEKTGTKPWDYLIASRDLSYQIGSLSKIIMQMSGERYSKSSLQELKLQAADELADILAEVLFIAKELNINMYEAWTKMIGSDDQKISERK
jgi:NTP pyrophosphatase (non-canonical NTP hydrolase)